MNKLELAGCIILDKQGRVLLLHRNQPGHSQWEIPGGKLEQTESAAAAATREVREELGVGVSITKKLGSTTFTENGCRLHYVWFQARITEGKPDIKEPAIFNDLRYLSFDELNAHGLELSANLQNFLDRIRERAAVI